MPSADEDDLAVEWARLVAEFGRGRASRIWLERYSGFDEGQTYPQRSGPASASSSRAASPRVVAPSTPGTWRSNAEPRRSARCISCTHGPWPRGCRAPFRSVLQLPELADEALDLGGEPVAQRHLGPNRFLTLYHFSIYYSEPFAVFHQISEIIG